MDKQISIGAIRQKSLPSDFTGELLNRDVALWIGRGVGLFEEEAALIADVVGLPWRLVICEEDTATLVSALRELAKTPDDLTSKRGFIDIIASDPEDIRLTPRALPVFFINGRSGAEESRESNKLSPHGMMRRRLNMLKRLIDEKPRMLAVVSDGNPETFRTIQELWEEGFRSRLTYFTQEEDEIQKMADWTEASLGPPMIHICELPRREFAESLIESTKKLLQPDRLGIRFRTGAKTKISLDVTESERAEYPLLDHYDLILERDLGPILPEELSEDELSDFFQRAGDSWKPYAANLPWIREPGCVKKLISEIERVAETNYQYNKLFLIEAESGAGGTTFAHSLAFEVAKAGFPTFVARQSKFLPDTTEVTSFLFRVHQKNLNMRGIPTESENEQSDGYSETPALIVFDAHHWVGNEQGIHSFMRALANDSRSAVVLTVCDPSSIRDIPEGEVINSVLTHSITDEEVLELGEHLNRFLAPKNRARTSDEWRGFANIYRPIIGDVSQSMSSFWISLGFWLRRQLNLDTSLQSWLYEQFLGADLSDELRCIILRVAALTLGKHPVPEGLLPTSPKGTFPYSVQLQEAQRQIPGLGLHRAITKTDRQWAVSHSLLARYLLNAVFSDRTTLNHLGFEKCLNVVTFHLELLRQTATDENLGTSKYLPLANDFAINILKLDRDGNREFFVAWREVLSILESMPERLWDTSRSFNHHVAISRRRVALDEQMFAPTEDEKKEQLRLAIEHLEYALNELEATDEEERDLNILNSLARAYQDIAELEQKSDGNPEEIQEYRDKALGCIRRALDADPNNSFVLETLARDFIQNAKASPTGSIGKVCEALGYIHRALSLESAFFRKERLTELLGECLNLLQGENGTAEIERLCERGKSLGFVAKAWLEFRSGTSGEVSSDFEGMSPSLLQRALNILSDIPEHAHTWLDLKLKYDILCSLRPLDFSGQIALLDELQGTTFKLDLQLQLEYAILLFQIGRSAEGSRIFRQLRREISDSGTFVTVPKRLRVLLTPDGKKQLTCEAVVSEERGYRCRAIIKDFGRDYVPFIPRDFGQLRMPVGTHFRCAISFSPNGPFANPPS